MADVFLPEGFTVERPGEKAPPVAAAPAEEAPVVYAPEGFDVEKPADESWSRTITDIPGEVGAEFTKGLDKVKSLGNREYGKEGFVEGVMKTGEALTGIPQMALSPIAGVRAPAGHALAHGIRAVGNLIAPDIVAKEDYEKAYENAKGGVDEAMAGFGSRLSGPRTPPAVTVRPYRGPGSEVVDAADRLSDAFGQVNVPRAVASDSMAVQRVGQGLRNVPIVGDAIPKATGALVDDLGRTVGRVADEYGTGTGPNVASRIGQHVEGAAGAETRAATDVARRSDESVRGAWQDAVEGANRNIAAREAESGVQARTAAGDMSPQDMGQTIISRLRAGEAEARANKEQLYTRAGQADASVRADEVANVRSRVAQGMENDGVIVDPSLTPAANRMMDELTQLSKLNVTNKAVGARPAAHGDEAVAGLSVQAIEQARKKLGFFRSAATNDADRRAATSVMRHFDEWQSNAFETALLSGDEKALSAYRAARDANTNWRNRFFNAEDDAGNMINKIVTGEVTPQEVANLIVGSGQVGSKGVASRLLTRLAEATGGDPEVVAALRGGVWNRLTQSPEGVAAKAPAKIADDISQFLHGSGRDVANRLFTAEQRASMENHADTLRRGQTAREAVSEVAKQTEPVALEVPKGPAQQLADTVVGRGKSDEALFRTIDDYAKSGGRANLKSLSDLVRSLPAQERADLAGAIVRNLGKNAEGKFSPDVFVTDWSKYTPQAKAILFGNAGHTLRALDDMMIISQRLKDTGKKFGNPSGTAQNTNLVAALAAVFYDPTWTTAGALTGGAILSRVLAAPAGARNASNWAKAYAAVQLRPTAQSMLAYQSASKALASTAQGMGLDVSLSNFMKVLQAPATGPAEQDQREQQRPKAQ